MSEGERARWLFQSAAAATPRSSLELLNLRFPFSQLGLMSAGEFAKQAERRRSKGLRSRPAISTQVLEELHRHGVLIPLFRVDLTEGEPSRQVDLSQSLSELEGKRPVEDQACGCPVAAAGEEDPEGHQP